MARLRSPNYPNISLPEAIGRLKVIHAAEQHLAAPKEVIARHLGYNGMNGASIKLISALNKYGLLEEASGDKMKVSSLGLSILYPKSEEEKQAAIREAAFKPGLFAEINAEWEGGSPSDANLRSYLIRRNFASDALDRVIQSYRDTMELVTSESGSYTVENGANPVTGKDSTAMQGQTPPTAPRATSPPAIPLPSGEPYRLSLAGGRLQGSFDLTNVEDADEMIRAIDAWKALLKTMDSIKKPTDNSADQSATKATGQRNLILD